MTMCCALLILHVQHVLCYQNLSRVQADCPDFLAINEHASCLICGTTVVGWWEHREKTTLLLDLEASWLALVSTDHMRQSVTLQELYQCIGTVRGEGKKEVWWEEREHKRGSQREKVVEARQKRKTWRKREWRVKGCDGRGSRKEGRCMWRSGGRRERDKPRETPNSVSYRGWGAVGFPLPSSSFPLKLFCLYHMLSVLLSHPNSIKALCIYFSQKSWFCTKCW